MHSALDPVTSAKWETRTRVLFYTFGIVVGGILTYTSRHFINGDAINYMEMGEALRYGNWTDFVNLTASPGYAALLGLGQILLNTDRTNEIPLLKTVNFGCMIIAMWACDVFLKSLKRHYVSLIAGNRAPLPWFMIMALAYSMFLFCALDWVRPRLVAPEMAVLASVLLSMAIILEIKEDPNRYRKFFLLGLSSAGTYLLKTFFFPFSIWFFLTAGFACGSIKKAIPRMAVAVMTMLLVCSPWLLALSWKLGHLSYGETGSLNYGIYVKGEGKSVHSPVLLATAPEVLLYQNTPFENSTRPATFDPSYWKIGIEPIFDLKAHARLFLDHTYRICCDQPWLFLLVVLWVVWNARLGSLRVGPLWPLPVQLCLALPAAIGIAMYCVIHVEMRYLAPFMLLMFVALVLCPRYDVKDRALVQKSIVAASIVVAAILGFSVSTVVDQSLRSLTSTSEKPSYRDAYFQMMAVKDYLNGQGAPGGTSVALVGTPPSYWGRMAGVKISAEIPKDEEVLSTSPEKRKASEATLRSVGINFLVAKGKNFAKLTGEGWSLVPGTSDFYVFASTGKPPEPTQIADLKEGTPVPASAPSTPVEAVPAD